MRISEIIFEARESIVKNKQKPHRDQEAAMPASHRVAGTADRHYDLNRIMMTVAGADGRRLVNTPNVHSWAGKNNIAQPFSKLETDMLRQAYEAMGAEWDDILKPNPDQKSIEARTINNRSPIAKNKKNKYGV